jgi:stearoyl-CoA desaturase (delta-9 desaturase)
LVGLGTALDLPARLVALVLAWMVLAGLAMVVLGLAISAESGEAVAPNPDPLTLLEDMLFNALGLYPSLVHLEPQPFAELAAHVLGAYRTAPPRHDLHRNSVPSSAKRQGAILVQKLLKKRTGRLAEHLSIAAWTMRSSAMTELSPFPVADPVAEIPPREAASERVPWSVQVATVLTIVIPLLGLVAAPFFCWGWGFSWVDFGLLVGMYVLTVIGITVGFHRLFTHRSFETSMPVKFILAVLGSMAVQGPLLKWVAMHRRHHQHADTPADPHSPHHHGEGVWGLLRGAWHAHIGWFFAPEPEDLPRYVPDLRKSRTLRVASALFPLWVLLGLLMPAVLGGVISLTWAGVWTGLIWGGLVRLFLVHHVTWSVNSACHLWGFRPYRSEDQSRDNIVFGVLAMGEGWHHTHHTFPTSARHGLRWWQIDMSYWIIRALAWLRLAWDVRVPTKQAQEQQRLPDHEKDTGRDSGST